MIILLRDTYYHYCNIDQITIDRFRAADSLGRFYNQNIRVSANAGLYDCRKGSVPTY